MVMGPAVREGRSMVVVVVVVVVFSRRRAKGWPRVRRSLGWVWVCTVRFLEGGLLGMGLGVVVWVGDAAAGESGFAGGGFEPGAGLDAWSGSDAWLGAGLGSGLDFGSGCDACRGSGSGSSTELAGVGRRVGKGKTVLSFPFVDSIRLGAFAVIRFVMSSFIRASKALLS